MSEVKSFNQWMVDQGFNAIRHANCCRIAYEGGQQSMQAEIDQLKTQLNNMEACYIQKKKEYEGLQDRAEGVLGKMLTKAESLQQGCDGYTDPVELCQAEGIEMCMRFLEKALRGEHANPD